jgi:hypothetical protein
MKEKEEVIELDLNKEWGEKSDSRFLRDSAREERKSARQFITVIE